MYSLAMVCRMDFGPKPSIGASSILCESRDTYEKALVHNEFADFDDRKCFFFISSRGTQLKSLYGRWMGHTLWGDDMAECDEVNEIGFWVLNVH